MNTYIAILLACAIAVMCLFVRGHLRKQSAPAKVNTSARRSRKSARSHTSIAKSNKTPETKALRKTFRAASVHGLSDCCHMAKAIEGKRFLMDNLPSLPLDSCDRVADCKCSLTNHTDRRNDDNRRNRYAAFVKTGVDGDTATNRRSGMERRSGIADEFKNIKFK
jgi:hypothetical protein